MSTHRTPPQITTAAAGDTGWIAELIARAFVDLPVSQYVVPQRCERVPVLTGAFALVVEHAAEHGLIHTTTDRAAVAVWLPGGDGTTPPITDYDQRLQAVCGIYTPRFRDLDAAMDAAHPDIPRHNHLVFLAVRPGGQGAGLGSALLHHHHQALDEAGTPAYLEASSQGSHRLYQAFGYRDLGEPFRVGSQATMWPMWRNPTGHATAAGHGKKPRNTRQPTRSADPVGNRPSGVRALLPP